MATSIKLLVKEAVSALKAAQYQESTIYEYNKTFAQLLELAEERQIEYYCNDLAEEFRNDTGNKWTGQYSLYRWKRRNRCIEMFNWYEEHGYFKLDAFIKTRIEKPATKYFQELHSAYLYQLSECDLKQNTVDSYRNISCKFLQLLEKHQYTTISDTPVSVVYDFISHIRNTWSEESLRTALSGLRSFLVFTESEPLLLAMLGLKAPKVRKIIPVLMPEDEESLWSVLRNDGTLTNRDKAITLLGLLTGIRACDIVNLKLSDIDWRADTISIVQQKTGKPLVLPLLPIIGNAISTYIIEERPKVDSSFVFLSQQAPFKPLAGHSACYKIIQKVFKYAEIDIGAGVIGTRLLRHNAASKMLSKDISIQTISSMLGHTDVESTNVYLTTDELKMRECVLPLTSIPMGLEVLK